jgi:SPP1 gp7 family putative phage head morphogenesis protein
MILRLDPDDDDAEAQEIADLAGQHVDQIGTGLQAQLDHIAVANGVGEIQRVLDTLPTSTLQEAVDALLQASAGRGVRMAADNMERVMFGVNWRLPNEMALGWARSASYDLVHGITETSRRVIQDALGDWVRDGGRMDDLIARLAPQFGPVRAELIAITESTNAYREGSRILYREVGVRRVQILTNRDDRVCDICRPLDQMIVDINTGVPGVGWPAFHVQCRCFIAPVIE